MSGSVESPRDARQPTVPTSRALRARWIFPGDAPPLAHACVTMHGDTIIAVGEAPDGVAVTDLGDVAIVPGLVNAHTHLEFSDRADPIGQSGMRFSDWIRAVVEQRRRELAERSAEQLAADRVAATRMGVKESRTAGVTTLGEIARPGWSVETLDESLSTVVSPSTVVFLELLGLRRERTEPLLALAREHLDLAARSRHVETSASSVSPRRRWLAGLSPHSPYTVSPALLERVCDLSREQNVPVAMHLAESFEELELLSAHSGPLVETLETLDAWDPTAVPRGITPSDYVEILSRAARTLVVHGNFLGPREWTVLAQHRDRMSLVYCPRTHARFLGDRYPLRELLAAGVRVAVGTDSRATNPDLSLWSELKFIAAKHADVAPERILSMGTADGAAALGLADRGRIAPGMLADLTIVQGATGEFADPWEWLWSEPSETVALEAT